MTDRERRLIEIYIPSPRDSALAEGEYYVKDTAGRIRRVRVREICPSMDETEEEYGVYTAEGMRIKDWTESGDFPLRHMYDNKNDCKNETHHVYNEWERLRELQMREVQANS